MEVIISLLLVATASAAWTDSPKLTGDVDGKARSVRCIPCEERRGDPSRSGPNSVDWRSGPPRSASNADDFRGNGADNLGYDWSPKAWGGPAFPPKQDRRNGPEADRWNDRDGRRMPGWGCNNCGGEQGNGQAPFGRANQRDEVTVTSSVLGIRHKDDRRLPVDWPGDGRSMRWDGFRNGMPWERPDTMDRREDTGFRPWDNMNRGVSGWDSDGKGHYASDWSYGSGVNGKEGRPWPDRWDPKLSENERSYDHQGGNSLFGNSYPSTDRYPSNTWRPPTSTYAPKPFYQYPESSRPSLGSGSQAGYQTTSRPPPFQPSPGNQPWNYQPDRYGNRPDSWTSAPNQNYLPSNRPDRPQTDYGRPNRPTEGKPGMAIWNGRPENGRPPQGFYQGFITEIPNPGQGNPYNKPGQGTNQDRYPTDRYPGNGYPPSNPVPIDRPGYGGNNAPPGRPWPEPNRPYDSQIPNANKNEYGGGGLGPNNYPYSDKYPSTNPSYQRPGDKDRYPSFEGDRNRPYEGNNRYPTYGNDRDANKYPNLGNDRDRVPPYNRDPNRYNGDRDRYPNYGSDREPVPPYNDRESNNRYPNQGGDRDRNPSYGNDRDRNPSYGNDRDRNPSYGNDRDRYPAYGNDRDRDRYPSYGGERDRYPSRPGSSDHDRGPNPSADSGSWNYGEEANKDGTYRRSGGSYPPYKGGQYYTSAYLASASTPAASSQELENKKETTDSPPASQD